MGLLEPLKKLSPNLNISVAENELEITIPFKDIVDAVKNSMNEQLRQISTVTADSNGIRIRIKL